MSTKYLNSENIMRKVYDPSTESLKTSTIAVLDTNSVSVQINDTDDSIKIGNGQGDYLAINDDGSINANLTGEIDIEVNAVDGDSIAVVGTEDGTPSGTQHTLKIGSDGNARVGDNFSLVPREIDQITFVSVTPDGDPLVIEYRKSGNLVATLTITYDMNGHFQSVTRT